LSWFCVFRRRPKLKINLYLARIPATEAAEAQPDEYFSTFKTEMIRIVLLCFFVLCCVQVFAQPRSNLHSKPLELSRDTVQLDTLSLIPGSIILRFSNGQLIDTSFYHIDHAKGLLIPDRKKIAAAGHGDSISVSYRTFPFLFSQELKHKDLDRIKPDLFARNNPFSYDLEPKSDDIFRMDGLNKSGSISRGISFGNNQDVVVNSNLNLQLSGHLSNNVDILMAATDNNIPIQPDGNTQQLQEFDKVFIQLSNENSRLIAGDFQLGRPQSYFMNFNKKAQGVSFATAQRTHTSRKDTSLQGLYQGSLSAAVSRGKFARNQIQGVESNQGPYRLRGADNENFIIVLSGTEKVYIDGRLMVRGQENDYVINYNTSEITFTARQLITKDKRIIVEFQYSDKNYARSLIHFGNDYQIDKTRLHLNVYSEQDSKNQPLQQELSDDQRRLLSSIGDTLTLAVIPSFDSVAFTNSEVLYAMRDTTAGSYSYNDVFVYSTSADSAHYRVTFSNVGLGNGNYRQISSSANGKVFEWIIPDTISGRPRGSYEPVLQLVTPRKKQMVTAAIEQQLGKYSRLSVEGAVSNNDINTFSSADSRDDIGYAGKLNFDNAFPLRNAADTTSTLLLVSNVNYEYVHRYFSPVERYRSIEFERDWNRTILSQGDQHIAGAALGIVKKNLGTAGYRFSTFIEDGNYQGFKHFVNLAGGSKGFRVGYDGSYLNSSGNNNTEFYRHKSSVSQSVRWLTVGVKDEFERNLFTLANRDSLTGNSYQFWEWQAFAQNADTTKNRYGINYKQRTDHAVQNLAGITNLRGSAFAESFGGFLDLIADPDQQLRFNASYRRLTIRDSLLTSQKPDNTLVARIEYALRLFKGAIFSNTFYEIGSGLELRKEFSYLEVAPGQGVYTWIDYNENGVKELNEFEISAFPDQATYIKVFTPTSDYIKTFSNQFSQTLTLRPAAVWSSKKGIKKILAMFSDQVSYRVDRKSTEEDLAIAYNPFLASVEDSTLVTLNSSLRNTLFFNQLSPVFGMDLSYQDSRNKSLLTNGFDTRSNIYQEAHMRWNIIRTLNFDMSYRDGEKSSSSQFFSNRDYNIQYYEAQPKISYQPNTSFRLTLSFRYTEKKNGEDFGGQKAELQDFGTEIKYNVLQKGSLNLKANYILISFDGPQNTSLAFEMLDALKTGRNITWGIAYQRNLSGNLQLSLTYDGRQSQDSKAIHTGGAQVRAYF
jgi:hypothetical protein